MEYGTNYDIYFQFDPTYFKTFYIFFKYYLYYYYSYDLFYYSAFYAHGREPEEEEEEEEEKIDCTEPEVALHAFGFAADGSTLLAISKVPAAR